MGLVCAAAARAVEALASLGTLDMSAGVKSQVRLFRALVIVALVLRDGGADFFLPDLPTRGMTGVMAKLLSVVFVATGLQGSMSLVMRGHRGDPS